MDELSIKRNIAELRKGLKLTQEGVADELGMSRTAYRNIEAGDTRIINENVYKIAEMFGVAVEEVLLGRAVTSDQRVREEQGGYGRGTTEKDVIAALREQNAALKVCVEAQQETIKSKDEIISYLRSYQEK